MPSVLRIGTRGSPLALVQTAEVRGALESRWASEGLSFSVETITTTGDKVTDRPLTEIGGKGLFTKEIDRALLSGEVDCAVHSTKDMESVLAPGIVIAGVLKRSDPRDCLIGAKGLSLADLPKAARLGTSAVRRRAQVLARRPDLQIVPMRGNVGSRLQKLERGEADAIILAKAGLDRLGKSGVIGHVFDVVDMLPDACQGVIAIAAREGDARVRRLIEAICDQMTFITCRAERALSAGLDGSCRSPIGAYAEIRNGRLVLDGAVFSPNGEETIRRRIEGAPEEAADLGVRLARQLRAEASPRILKVLDGA
jgi:hydroxymethylbilane synthase